MKSVDIKSVLIGVLCTALVFVLIGAKSQSENLGDITVNSITVVDENGDKVCKIYSYENGGALYVTGQDKTSLMLIPGAIALRNSERQMISFLGINDDNGGFLKTYNSDGKNTIFLGTGVGNGGHLKTYKSDGNMTSLLGTGKSGNGFFETFNLDGNPTSFLGALEEGFGILQTYNELGQLVGYLGSDKEQDGIIILTDRYGDAGWSESGKQ